MAFTPDEDQGDIAPRQPPYQRPFEPPTLPTAQPSSYTSTDYSFGRPNYAQPVSPPAGAPFNLEALLRALFTSCKRVLTHPSVATFDAELPAANWPALWVGASILAISWMFIIIIVSLENPSPYASGPSIGTYLTAFPVFFATLFFSAGVYHLVAKLLGGTATYLTYAYAIALVAVPINAVTAVAFVIPVLGVLVMLAGGLYALYLLVLATQSAHRVSAGKAVAIVLTPAAVSLVLSCLLYAALFAFVLALLYSAH